MLNNATPWRERLATITATMREMSAQTDPQEMVRTYVKRMERIVVRDRLVTLSRRGLEHPFVYVTRDSTWTEEINPWEEQQRLPVLEGGLFAELVYGDEPRIIEDPQLADDDPAREYLAGYRSLLAIPLFDQGQGLNMVVMLRHDAGAFNHEDLPEMVWMSNLFGRATQNLVLMRERQKAFDEVDQELRLVADLQRALLPARLPDVPGLDMAAVYETSRRVGGDYYDLFPLADGRWGILIADVSGHGPAAAVGMAITHALAHTAPEELCPPGRLLTWLNTQSVQHYTDRTGGFVTAFYGIYDPRERTLWYACAGHNPPRLKRCADGSLALLDAAHGLPIGVAENETYNEATHQLQIGDQIVFYTDGITEAFNPNGEMFGTERLDRVLENCSVNAASLIDELLAAVSDFTAGQPADDDRTILIARVVK